MKVLASPFLLGLSGIESLTGKVKYICEGFAFKTPREPVSYLWPGLVFGAGGRPVHGGMLSSTPGFYTLEAGSTLSRVETTQKDSRHGQIVPLLSTI